jgi:hypothetical protein
MFPLEKKFNFCYLIGNILGCSNIVNLISLSIKKICILSTINLNLRQEISQLPIELFYLLHEIYPLIV